MPKKSAPKTALQLALDEQVALQANINRAARSITKTLAPFHQRARESVLGLVVQAMNASMVAETAPTPCEDSVPTTPVSPA